MSNRPIEIEGLSPEEIENLPDDLMDGLVFCDEPLAFRIGSAEILGQFSIWGDILVVELARLMVAAKASFRHFGQSPIGMPEGDASQR